mmetsp:Transcript_33518/g.48848  ORF Transcript_33518/g.48848 Transcript_33518/m.48848 type:complete len:285 (+) Transcript_33518:217-1071(+)
MMTTLDQVTKATDIICLKSNVTNYYSAAPLVQIENLQKWPLVDTKVCAIVLAIYFFLVILFRARMMSKTPTSNHTLYSLKFAYNSSQIMICSYIVIEGICTSYDAGYTFLSCAQDFDRSHRLERLFWLYYVKKIWDFSDTFIIIAQQNWRQLSFLHLFHHSSAFLAGNLGLKMEYKYTCLPPIVINSFVHVVLYTYFFVSLHTKDINKQQNIPIWWKDHVTLVEIIQFIILFVHLFSVSHVCNNPFGSLFCLLRSMGLFYYMFSMILFLNFYIKSQEKKGKKWA